MVVQYMVLQYTTPWLFSILLHGCSVYYSMVLQCTTYHARAANVSPSGSGNKILSYYQGFIQESWIGGTMHIGMLV